MQNGGGQSRTYYHRENQARGTKQSVSLPPLFVYSLAAGFQGKASPFPGAALFLSLDRKRKGKETKVTRGFFQKNASLSPP